MIRIFRTNNLLVFPILLLLIIALHLIVFNQPDLYETAKPVNNTSPFSNIIYNLFDFLFNSHVLSLQLFAIILIITQAFLLNSITNLHNLFNKINYLPALFYIVCSSMYVKFLLLSPELLANTFLLLALLKVFSLYKKKKIYTQVFDIGFLISIASLFYFPSVIFLFFFYIVLIITRTFNWREWIIALIAFCIPYFLTAVYYFWNDNLYQLWENQILCQFRGRTANLTFNTSELTLTIYFVFILLIAFIKFQQKYLRSLVETRNYLSIIVWYLIIGSISFLLVPILTITHFFILSIPTAIFLAYYFNEIKKTWLAEILFIILLALIYINQYDLLYIRG